MKTLWLGQSQGQNDNQTGQFAKQMGFNYDQLSQQDREFLQKLAQDAALTREGFANQASIAGGQLGLGYAQLGQNDAQFGYSHDWQSSENEKDRQARINEMLAN